jgi:hypothetical protein
MSRGSCLVCSLNRVVPLVLLERLSAMLVRQALLLRVEERRPRQLERPLVAAPSGNDCTLFRQYLHRRALETDSPDRTGTTRTEPLGDTCRMESVLTRHGGKDFSVGVVFSTDGAVSYALRFCIHWLSVRSTAGR